MYWLVKLFIFPIAALPFKLRSNLGALLGQLLSYIPTREQKIAKLQLACVLKTNNVNTLTSRVYQNLARNFIESLNLKPILNRHDNYIELSDPDSVLQLIQEARRPVIVLTAHTGNWDLMAAYFIKLGIPITTIGKKARGAWQQKILEALRANYGIHTIWRDSSTNSTRQIIDAILGKKVIATLIDQDLNIPGYASNFFGRFVKTPGQLIKLGKRYDAIFVTCFNYRNDSLKFKIVLNKIPTELSVTEILDQYHQRLEQIILKVPDQWVWIHKRWRSNSLSHTMSGKEYMNFLERELNAN